MGAVELDWSFPATKEGLRDLLDQQETVRSAGNEAEVCRGLLRQAFMVKWAGSDTESGPMDRSYELAREAYEIAVRLDNAQWQFTALDLMIPFSPPEWQAEALKEMERLAELVGTPKIRARLSEVRARQMGQTRMQAIEHAQEALNQYRELEDWHAMSRCCFTLAIRIEDDAEAAEAALLSAEYAERAGDFAQAVRALTIAGMYGSCAHGLLSQEPVYKRAFHLTRVGAPRFHRSGILMHLAKIALLHGRLDRAEALAAAGASNRRDDVRDDEMRWMDRRWHCKFRRKIARLRGDEAARTALGEDLRALHRECRDMGYRRQQC